MDAAYLLLGIGFMGLMVLLVERAFPRVKS